MAESLIKLQKWMHTALLDPQAVPEAGITDRLVPNPRLSAQDALAIYQRSYSLRIAACIFDADMLKASPCEHAPNETCAFRLFQNGV